MGVSEMLVSTAICGIVFSLFSGQPLIIIGATGPVLVFEEALYKVCCFTVTYFQLTGSKSLTHLSLEIAYYVQGCICLS